MVTECVVTSELLSTELDPYASVAPYSTWLEEAWSVVQVMVAAVDEIDVARTDVITGAGPDAAVAKVKFADVARVPGPFADRTA
jgi:hypothetical protein